MVEKYVNEDTIVKNEIYEIFKDSITCPICKNLMIEQVMCLNCQNIYCKKCIEDLKTKGEGCPNHCDNSEFKDVIEKKNNITKFKFKCIKDCGEEIPFKDIERHYSTICQKKKIKAIDSKKAAEYTNKTGKEIPKFISMTKIFKFIFFIYSYNFRC